MKESRYESFLHSRRTRRFYPKDVVQAGIDAMTFQDKLSITLDTRLGKVRKLNQKTNEK